MNKLDYAAEKARQFAVQEGRREYGRLRTLQILGQTPDMDSNYYYRAWLTTSRRLDKAIVALRLAHSSLSGGRGNQTQRNDRVCSAVERTLKEIA